MTEVLLQPFLAGLSMGLFCGAYCLPFVVPLLVSEQRDGRSSAGVVLRVIGGRLVGYIVFGALTGFLGERLDGAFFHLASAAALVALSLVLIVHAVGLARLPRPACAGLARRGAATPWVMGLLMGFNVCPPFLLSVAYVFTLHSAWKGIVYFLVFFAATSLYFLPLAFLGLLSRMEEFRRVARLSAVFVGVLFAVYGCILLVRGTGVLHAP